MRKKILRISIIIFVIIISIGVIDFKREEVKIKQIDNSIITSITLQHYDEVIVIDKSDVNFLKIIDFASDIRLNLRYIGFPVYGQSISITFHNNDGENFEISTGVDFTIVNNKRFFTAFRSKKLAKELSSILGKYYGYNQ